MSRPASAHGAANRIHPRDRLEGAHAGIHGGNSTSETHNKGYAHNRLRHVMGSSSGKAGGKQQAQTYVPMHSRPGQNDLVSVRHMDDMQSCQARIGLLWTTLRMSGPSGAHTPASTIYHQSDPLAESAVLELAMLRLQNQRTLVLGVLKCIKARESVLEKLVQISQCRDESRFLDSTYDSGSAQAGCLSGEGVHRDDTGLIHE
jgi:hypothetical protein